MSDKTGLTNGTATADEERGPKGMLGWLRDLAKGRNGDANIRETIEDLIEESEGEAETEEPINAEERLMLMNILELSEHRVEDVMVPRADVVALEASTDLSELVKIFGAELHSRMPVYRNNLDDVIGMIHIKDLISYWERREDFSLRRMAREVLFVPPVMPVLDLLLKMRTTHIHMAVVVDEYGGTDGLVTIEDLVEEIVGEIEDEHDQTEGPLIVARSEGVFDADARAPIDEFESHVGLDLLNDEQDEEVDTLGGLVFFMLGRVPKRGELISHPAGLEFEVLDADPRRIKRLRVRRKDDALEPLDADDNASGDQ